MSRTPSPRQLTAYVCALAKRMRLGEWELDVSLLDGDGENAAEFHVIDGSKRARVHIHASVFTLTPAEQRVVIVHELTHAYFHNHGLVSDAITAADGAFLGPFLGRLFDDLEEQVVDDVSRVVALSMPLPPWCS